jgi:crotonobetainyl-CoA:carnitine CoA-transferase CaiB-like acyl-CoA transferase
MNPISDLPLKGVKILDLTRLLPGPFATQYLADLGAEILRVESPTPDLARLSPPYIYSYGSYDLSLNRNKKSIVLNLKTEKGKFIFFQLLNEYDVIIEQFRPGVVAKLGIDYESVKEVKNNIIYLSLSGYGQNGPYKDKPAHDINYLSEAGLLHDQFINKEKIPFILPQIPIADLAGSFSTVIGILTALYQRSITKKGQYIDISMFDSIVSWLNGSLSSLGEINNVISPSESVDYMLNGKKPYYRIYRTLDDPISIGALEPHFWEEFCQKLGLKEFVNEQHNQELHLEMENKIESILLTKTSSYWIEYLKNICVAPVNKLSEISKNPQLNARNMFQTIKLNEIQSVIGINNPVNFNQNFNFSKPPQVSENAVEILSKLGYSQEEIIMLKNEKII